MFIRNKNLVLLVGIITIVVLFQISYASGRSKWDKYDKAIRYSTSNWLSNDKLLCARKVTYSSTHKDLLSHISKGTFEIHREEFQICSMNIDGTDERVIRSFAKNYKRWGYGVFEDEVMQGVNRINHVEYNPHRHLIAFQTHGSTRAIFIMNADGTNVEKIVEEGSNPRFSPDGKKLLYSTSRQYINPEYTHLKENKQFSEIDEAIKAGEYYVNESFIWIIDLDTNDKVKVTDNGFGTAWHPDGNKIFFSSTDRLITDRRNYIINIDGTGRKEFIRDTGAFIRDLSSDGSKMISGGSVYDTNTGDSLIIEGNIPNNPFFSPDGTKIVGDWINKEGAGFICVVNSDGTEFKIIR